MSKRAHGKHEIPGVSAVGVALIGLLLKILDLTKGKSPLRGSLGD